MESTINMNEQLDETKVLADIRETEKMRQEAQQKNDEIDRKIRAVQE